MADDDTLCWAVYPQAVPTTSRLDGVAVILAVERAIFHQHIFRRVNVQSICAPMSVTLHCHSAYDDLRTVLRHDVPIKSLLQRHPLDEYTGAVDRGKRLGQKHGDCIPAIVDALFQWQLAHHFLDVSSPFGVETIYFTVGCRPHHLAPSCQGNVVGFVGIDECSQGVNVNTLIACIDYRQVILHTSAEVQFSPFVQVEVDVALELNASRLPHTCGDVYRATSLGGHTVDGLLYAFCLHTLTLQFHRHLPVRKSWPCQLRHLKRSRNGSNFVGHRVGSHFTTCRDVLRTGAQWQQNRNEGK